MISEKIARIAKVEPRVKQPVMLLWLITANTRSIASKLIDPMVVTELGMISETFSGRSWQSMWSANPMQNFFTPSEQFFGIESAVVSIAVTALEILLWASLAALEATVAAALAALWA